MKKFFIALLLLLPYLAHAGDYALQIEQKVPGTNPYYNALYLEEIGQSGFMFYNYTTHLPRYYRVGAGLSCNDTTETCSATGMAPTSFPFSGLTGLPTTRAGYGITDALGASDLAPYVTSSTFTSGLAGKFNVPTGTTAQYLRGDGSAATFPTLFSGIYADLTGKPTLFSGAYADLTGKPVLFSGAFADLSSKPTTLTGYGITDGYSTTNPASYVSAAGARSAISLTTSGSGAATYSASTGVLNIPTPTAAGPTAYTGTTAKLGSYRVYQTVTITTAGTAVFQLTADGTSTGTALFTNETFTDSVQPIVNDATASYQLGWVFSNANKTLTVTVNKLSTANILTGVLGQAAAPVGTVVKLAVEGR